MHCNDHSAERRVAANAAEAGSGTLDRSQLLSAQEVQLVRQTLFNPLRGMTPQRVVGWLDNVESGFLSDALKAWELMASRDPVIRAVRGKRQSAVTQHSWSILETSAVTDDPSLANDADEQSKALKYFWNNIRVVNALDRNETGGFAKFARFATDPDSFKYGGFHFIWRPGPKGITATLEYVPGYLFENTSGELRFTGVNPSTVYGTELDPTNWLPMAGEGLMSAGSISYSLKHGALNAWVKYCNRFGMPFPVGKVNGGSSSKEWADMRATIRGIQNDNGAVINATSALELLEAGGNGVAPSETLIKLIDQDLMALWRGGDAGTRSRDRSDGNGVSLQAKEALLIEAGDCAAVSEVMQAIDRLVLAWHFGANVEPLVYSQVNGPSMVDVMERMKVDEFLIGKGARISLSSLMEAYGREEAEPDEEVAGQPATTKPSVAANAFDPEKHPRDISGKFAETVGIKWSEAVTPLTVYRAGSEDENGIKPFASFSEERDTAEAYLDNPGYGGNTLREIQVDAGNVLDADTTTRSGMRDLAEKLGLDREVGDGWFDDGFRYPWEESKRVKEALTASDFDSVRYTEDYPEGAKTIIFTRPPRLIDRSKKQQQEIAINAAPAAAISDTDRAAICTDLQPLVSAVATLVQNKGGTPPELNWDAITDAVFLNRSLESELMGQMGEAFLLGLGIGPDELAQVLKEATADNS